MWTSMLRSPPFLALRPVPTAAINSASVDLYTYTKGRPAPSGAGATLFNQPQYELDGWCDVVRLRPEESRVTAQAPGVNSDLKDT